MALLLYIGAYEIDRCLRLSRVVIWHVCQNIHFFMAWLVCIVLVTEWFWRLDNMIGFIFFSHIIIGGGGGCGDNFCDLQLAFFSSETFWNTGSHIQERIASLRTVISFRSQPLTTSGAKTLLAELPPMQVYSFPLTVKLFFPVWLCHSQVFNRQ